MKVAPFSATLDHDEFFQKFDLDIPLPPPPKISIPTSLEIAWQKVCNFFRKIWSMICFWETDTKFKLTDRQIKLIERAKDQQKLFDKKKDPKDVVKLETVKSLPELTQQKPFQPEYPQDKDLKNFCIFFENFSQILMLNCVNDEKIKPGLPSLKKEVLEGIENVNKWVDVIVNLKNSAAPLFKNFGNLEDPLLTILAQQLFQVLLQPLSHEANPRHVLEKALSQRIHELKGKKEITEEQCEKLISFINPTLRWLFNSNNWLLNSPHPILLHNFLADTINFLDSFSKLNKQGSLTEIIGEIKKQIEITFDADIQKLLQLNTKPVANILSNRLSELISNLPFQDSFNDLFDILNDHLEGWIQADNYKKEQALMITNAKHDVELQATSAEEVQKKQAAKELLKEVNSAGSEIIYLDQAFHEAFSKSSACPPQIQKLFSPNREKSISKIDDEIYEHIIEEILSCILPPELVKLPDGSHVEISGIAKIVNAIQYPENLDNLFNLIDKVVERVMKDGEFKDEENFAKYFQTLRRVVITQLIHQRVKELLKDGLINLFKKLIHKENLDEFLGDLILSPLIKIIFLGWVRASLSLKDTAAKFAPGFLPFLEETPHFKICLFELINNLYDFMKERTQDFNLIEAGFSKEAFRELIEPLILEIITNLLQRLKNDNPLKKITQYEVQSALQKYLTESNVAPNPRYTKIIMNALFSIGNFKLPGLNFTFPGFDKPLDETVINWMKNSITQQASNSFHQISTSYHPSISSLVDAGNKYFLNPEILKKVFFPAKLTSKEQEQKKKSVQETLQANIRRISSLSHDAIYRSLESGTFGSMIKGFSPTTTTITDTISSVFNKLMSSPALNKSLLVKITGLVEKSLKSAVEKQKSLDMKAVVLTSEKKAKTIFDV